MSPPMVGGAQGHFEHFVQETTTFRFKRSPVDQRANCEPS